MVVAELPTRAAAPALVVAAAAAVAVAGAAVAASLPWHTTYAALSPGVLVSDAAAAASLLVAGLALWLERPQDVRATLLVLASAAWACADWVGWQGGPDVVRTLGVVGHAALLPLVAHLVVHTWPAWRPLRLAMPWLYAVTLGIAVARLSVTDPLVDPACWQNCTANSLLVNGQPTIATGLLRVSLAISILTGAALVVAGCGLAVAGGHLARRQHLPDPPPRGGARGRVRRPGRARARRHRGDPPGQTVRGPAPRRGRRAGWSRRRSRPDRHALAPRKATHPGTGSQPRPVQGPVGRKPARDGAIGDPTVTVTYRVGDPEGWVDSTGRRVSAPDSRAAPGVVPVTRSGELTALISHDPEAAPDIHLASALGPAARLAVENESLQAQQRARLHDLRHSQRRIVDAADAERTRLERNLHDAAQASVLGVIATVQRARRAAQDQSDYAASQLLADAAGQAQATMAELRVLARGIHPAILDLEGLAAALETLADHAEIRVEMAVALHDRLTPEVERTVYCRRRRDHPRSSQTG